MRDALGQVGCSNPSENLWGRIYRLWIQQNVSRIVDEVIGQIRASLEIWPMLVEICYFHKDKREFPQLRIENKKIPARIGNGAIN
jgi:hypothetical protein